MYNFPPCRLLPELLGHLQVKISRMTQFLPARYAYRMYLQNAEVQSVTTALELANERGSLGAGNIEQN